MLRGTSRVRQLCCAVCLGLSTLPALRHDFLFSDDYYWYDIQHSRPWDASWEAEMMTVMNGRPLHGLLFIASFPAVATPEGWVALRAIGVVLLIVTAWAFARVLRRVWDESTADWVATAVVALPGFTLFTFWLITVPCMLAATCGALAVEFALSPAWRHRVVGGLFLLLGLANYQPFALVFFALLALLAAAGELMFAAYAVGVVSIGVYYVLARLSVDWYDFDMAGRGELAFLPLEKARWFFESATPFVAKLWSVALAPTVGVAALLVVAGVCSWRRRHAFRTLWPRLAFIAVAAATTVLPHLSVRETVTRWRTLLPLSVLLALMLFAALEVRRWPRRLLVGVVLALLGLRAFELERYAVMPERALRLQAAAELRRVLGADPGREPRMPETGAVETSTSAVRSAPAAGEGVFVLRATEHDAICGPRLSDDEFTAPSSQRDFAIPGILRLASVHEGLPLPAAIAQGTDAALARAPIVDLRRIPPEICAKAR